MADNYTNARLLCESLDVFAGQVKEGEREDIPIGYLLAGTAQARATLAVADALRVVAAALDDVTNAGSLHVRGVVVTREDRP